VNSLADAIPGKYPTGESVQDVLWRISICDLNFSGTRAGETLREAYSLYYTFKERAASKKKETFRISIFVKDPEERTQPSIATLNLYSIAVDA
jgi:hypothetical protein